MGEISLPLQKAKRIAGGNAALGRLLGITSQAVSQWRQVPADRAIDVERVTGVSRHELRPDLFVDPAPPAAEHAATEGGADEAGHFSRFYRLRRTHFASSEEIVEHVRALRSEWDRR